MNNKAKSSTPSFHSRLIELGKLYHLIQESDERDLERIIILYERGMKLASGLEKTIAEYEMRIEEVQAGNTTHDTQQDVEKEHIDSEEKTPVKNPEIKATKGSEKTNTISSEAQDDSTTSFELFSTESHVKFPTM